MLDTTVPVTRARAPASIGEVAAAVAFLTRIPVPIPPEVSRTGAAAFGLVGALVGIVGAVPVLLLGSEHALLASVGAISIVAILSGGLHLDGFADTADALAAGSHAERARTDPRAGSAGVAALALVLLAEAAAFAEVAGLGAVAASAALVAATSVSRCVAPVWAVIAGRRASPATGVGRWFAAGTRPAAAAFGVVTAVIAVVLLVEFAGPRILIAVIAGVAAATLVGLLVVRARGQLDGDGYGYLIESTFAAILVAAAIVR